MQLLVSWAIVAISTLYRRGTDDCADGEDCESEENSWWIVSGSSAINALGETVFILTVAASFLISFDSYINAKAREPTLSCHPCYKSRWWHAGIRPRTLRHGAATHAVHCGGRGAGVSCGRARAHWNQ